MVFSSVPVYLDPPNWNLQQAHQPASGSGGGGGGGDYHQLPPPGAVSHPETGMAAGSIRPNSMAERARLAKVPQPEPALKCPRCDSSNTKFCYFNNYSLSQPRHFCKTCRRYWTRGGALRNVPVGGGCRRNKRTKAGSSSSKSSAATAVPSTTSTSSTTATCTVMGGGAIPSNMAPPPPQLSFMGSLQYSMADYGGSNLGPNFPGILQPLDSVDHYQMESNTSVAMEQWRLQQMHQFPFLGGLEVSAPAPVAAGLFPFESGVDGAGYAGHGQVHHKASSSSLINQLASVKMEDSHQNLNLPRQYLSVSGGHDHFWSGNGGGNGASTGTGGSGWAPDLSGFNSSSGNLL